MEMSDTLVQSAQLCNAHRYAGMRKNFRDNRASRSASVVCFMKSGEGHLPAISFPAQTCSRGSPPKMLESFVVLQPIVLISMGQNGSVSMGRGGDSELACW